MFALLSVCPIECYGSVCSTSGPFSINSTTVTVCSVVLLTICDNDCNKFCYDSSALCMVVVEVLIDIDGSLSVYFPVGQSSSGVLGLGGCWLILISVLFSVWWASCVVAFLLINFPCSSRFCTMPLLFGIYLLLFVSCLMAASGLLSLLFCDFLALGHERARFLV